MGDNKLHTCSFFGHRKIEVTDELVNRPEEVDEDLIIEKKIDIFLFGSKSQFDKLMLQQAVSDFPEREKQLIYLRYFKHKTQAQVSEKLGVSQVQISRLEKKILQKLRMQIEE